MILIRIYLRLEHDIRLIQCLDEYHRILHMYIVCHSTHTKEVVIEAKTDSVLQLFIPLTIGSSMNKKKLFAFKIVSQMHHIRLEVALLIVLRQTHISLSVSRVC